MTRGATVGGAMCRRRHRNRVCAVRRDDHLGDALECPGLNGCRFLGHAPRAHAAANTFSEGEIKLMDTMLKTLLRGGDAATLTRSPDFPGVVRKVQAMKDSVARRKAGK